MKRTAALGLIVVTLSGCAAQRAERLFEAGDYAAAIDAYEAILVRRGDFSTDVAATLMKLAVAYAAPASPRYDPERSAHYLRLVAERFPDTLEAREAELMLLAVAATRRAEDLELELARRDEQLARLRAVLDSVAQAEHRLRSEVESKDEAAVDLEGRVASLTGKARRLTEEIAALQAELDAIKQIDLESATREGDPP